MEIYSVLISYSQRGNGMWRYSGNCFGVLVWVQATKILHSISSKIPL